MKAIAKRLRAIVIRRSSALRTMVAVALLGSLSLEILPCAFVESTPDVSGAQSERTFAVEPLQVCDHGDSFLGVLSDLPVILPGAPDPLPSPEVRRRFPEAVAFSPGQFHAPIDHPPRTLA